MRYATHQQIAVSGCLLCLLALATAVLWPALTGPFLFDDAPNLGKLGALGGVTDWHSFKYFVFGGQAGPLGRPISLLIFLLNDFTWPSNPLPFKYTNLLIHLLNGVLVFTLCRQLGRFAGFCRTRTEWLAITAAALWLLHPIQISAVMLVIQRMTELSALFTLAGLVAYLRGRRLIGENPARGYLWVSTGIGLGGILATFSKENGILLALYALIIEATLVASPPDHNRTRWRLWQAVFLVAPLAILLGRFAWHWQGVVGGYIRREFTLIERLMTEPRILFDYLGQIIAPRLHGAGLFHDDYPFSTGLLDPPITLLAIGGLAALLVSALLLRRRVPVYSFAVLWFLGGHALESTFIGLELFFSHRNYLPLLGPMFAIAYGAVSVRGSLHRGVPAFLVLAIGLCAWLTWQNAQTWGDKARLAVTWAKENPTSVRAQQLAADYWLGEGRVALSRRYLQRAAGHHPTDVVVQLQLRMLDCLQNRPSSERHVRILAAARVDAYQSATFDTIDVLMGYIKDDTCQGLTYAALHDVLDTLLENPKYAGAATSKAEVVYQRAKLYMAARHLTPAINTLDRVYALTPVVDVPLLQARLLITAGLPEDALHYLEIARHSESTSYYDFLVGRDPAIARLMEAAKKMRAKMQEETVARADAQTLRTQ